MKKTIIKDENTLEDISAMKRNLKNLRKIAGWTSEELGEILGLSKQTINGLENNPDLQLSKVQYIALLSVFEAKAEEDKNEALSTILNILFLKKNEYRKERVEIDKKITMIAGAATTVGAGVAASAALSPFVAAAFGSIGVIPGVLGGLMGLIINSKKK